MTPNWLERNPEVIVVLFMLAIIGGIVWYLLNSDYAIQQTRQEASEFLTRLLKEPTHATP